MAGEMIAMGGTCPAIFEQIGWGEWVLIVLVILLLFGGRKLPELARNLARGLRSFKDELEGVKKDIEEPPAKDKDQKVQKDQGADKTDKNKDA
jgi:sec-independent protein translocase protein TatA